MADNLNLKTLIRCQGVTGDTMDLGSGNFRHDIDAPRTWGNGTAEGLAGAIWSEERTIATGTPASIDLDLFDLDQMNAAGTKALDNVVFTTVKTIYLQITSGSTSILTMGGGTGGASPGDSWSGVGTPFAGDTTFIQVQGGGSSQGGVFVWENPNGGAVADGTSHILHMEASGAAVTYKLIIAGDIA